MKTDSGESFATLTHARLRVAQGDFGGASRILRVILEVQPSHHEARELLEELTGRLAVAHTEAAEEPAAATVPATAGDLAQRFRDTLADPRRSVLVERLSQWNDRAHRNRGTRHVR